MSMKTLTILQFIGMFSAYIFTTTVLPFFVIRKKIAHRRLAEQFLCSYMVGNFYVMNIVFVLQFMKISNGYTLAAATWIPAFVVWLKINHIDLQKVYHRMTKTIRLLMVGHMGSKTVCARFFVKLKTKVKEAVLFCFRTFYRHMLEWILLAGILVIIGWTYGLAMLRTYGYTASDSPVHLWWLNGLSENQLFIDGVYPFGFHCVIYYIHAVFGIDMYVFSRIFGFLQTIMIHMVLIVVLRLCCKSKYISYAMAALFILGNFWQPSTYYRYFSALPQEYGMIFILPSVYFLFRFFKERASELKKNKKMKESRAQLGYFAISFAMTLAVHFYGTMVAGLFCIGIAGGYLFWFVRKQYFVPIMVAGIISVMLAVAPMAFAFVTGTPLQGSLGWGMSVINGTEDEFLGKEDDSEEEETVEIVDSAGNAVTFFDESGNAVPVSELTTEQLENLKEMGMAVSGGAVSGGAASGASPGGQIKQTSVKERLLDKWSLFRDTVKAQIISEPQQWWYPHIILGAIGVLYVLGLLFLLFRTKRQYGAMLLSTGLFMTILLCLQAAEELGLPQLMDAGRCRIYFAYMVPWTMALAVDGGITLVTWPLVPAAKEKQIRRRVGNTVRHLLSLACVGLVVLILSKDSFRKDQIESAPLVTNEAITCLTNIIHSEKDETWTICSANDEMQMGVGHGYHYELVSFLREMEYNNMEEDARPDVRIPTENVFFFIEKVPIDYTVPYENSGQSVSEKGAEYPLPNVGGIGMYMGENRWILMSRIYQWVQEFKKLYPNEVKVYLETDKFVCYKVEQNTYRLFNFAIDYGYNTRLISQREESK